MRRSHASADDFEFAEVWRQCARCFVPQLVAGVATVGLHDVKPLSLAFQLDRHSIGAGAGKQALVRNFEQRIPIDRRIIFRSRGRARGRCGLQVDVLAGFGPHLHRIDKTVTPNPHSVLGLGQIGYQVTPAVVCDDDLGEFGRKIGRLGDNPDTRFRSGWTGNYAAKVTFADPGPPARQSAAHQAARAWPPRTQQRRPLLCRISGSYWFSFGRSFHLLAAPRACLSGVAEILRTGDVRVSRGAVGKLGSWSGTNPKRVPIVPCTRKAPHPILLRFLCQSPSKPELMEFASDTMSLAPVQAWSKRGHHFPPEVTG